MTTYPFCATDEQDGSEYSAYIASEASPTSLTEPAFARHGRKFLEHGIVVESALLSDDSLPPDLDKMRGDDTLILTRRGLGVKAPDDIWYTDIRLKCPANNQYQSLPSYNRCKEGFFAGVPEMLAKVALTRTIQEAGAFAGDSEAPSSAMHATFRKLVEMVLESPSSDIPGDHVAWFMGMAWQTHVKLCALYSPENLEPVGLPTPIDLAKQRVLQPLVPLVMYPDRFIENLAGYLYRARNAYQQRRRGNAFLFFVERLGPETMPEGCWSLRNELLNAGYQPEI